MNPAQLKSELLRLTRGAYPDIDIDVQPSADDPTRLAIYFIEPTFSVLYLAQRYHHLGHLIPQEFFDEHLSNTSWFELAPGEKAEELRYPDEELIQEITPYVMKALLGAGVIEALDDLMCPANPSVRRSACFRDYRHSREVLLARGFKEDELFDVFHVLMARGGFCDCEVLYNAADSSRLKAEYWRARAENREPYDPHRSV
jgi:hypothetical protein